MDIMTKLFLIATFGIVIYHIVDWILSIVEDDNPIDSPTIFNVEIDSDVESDWRWMTGTSDDNNNKGD